MLVFIRLRALLSETCPDHPVAVCEVCSAAYHPEQLGTDIGAQCSTCRCGGDLRESLKQHARTCRNLTPPKPLARAAPSFDARPFPRSRRLAV